MGDLVNFPHVSIDDVGADVQLPNEVLLHIFRFLDYENLISAEQVCSQWKDVVEIRFATEKELYILSYTKDFALKLRRYGSSIQTFDLFCYDSEIDWAEEIADRFPNLSTMNLLSVKFTNDSIKKLSTKCQKLKKVDLFDCNLTDEGFRYFLQAHTGLQSLKMYTRKNGMIVTGGRRGHRNSNNSLKPADASAVFSICRSLEKLELGGTFGGSDTASFSRFCKECVTLRKLAITFSNMPKKMFEQIQNCSLLEELKLYDCQNIKGSTLIQISKGCPNLRSVSLFDLPPICAKGLKGFANCRNLSSFETDSEKMNDQTLIAMAKCDSLREMRLFSCLLVSDRGCAALLAHCPQLELLDLQCCNRVGNRTVDSAIVAVASRKNGLVLQLIVGGTGITPQSYENCHPLLRLEKEMD